MSASKKQQLTISGDAEKTGISQDCFSKIADIFYDTTIKVKSSGNQNSTIGTLSKTTKPLGVLEDDLIQKQYESFSLREKNNIAKIHKNIGWGDKT